MTDETLRTSATSYFFIVLLLAGCTLVILSLLTRQPQPLFGGIREVGIGLLCLGGGEWINHPLQKTRTCQDRWNFIFTSIRHRRRNPSSLGNLLEIAGLILLFTGLADFF